MIATWTFFNDTVPICRYKLNSHAMHVQYKQCNIHTICFALLSCDYIGALGRATWITHIRGCRLNRSWAVVSQRSKFMGPTWGPPGSCRPQMGPMLAPWTLLSGYGYSRAINVTMKYMGNIDKVLTMFKFLGMQLTCTRQLHQMHTDEISMNHWFMDQ